jgi:hypothetical protein
MGFIGEYSQSYLIQWMRAGESKLAETLEQGWTQMHPAISALEHFDMLVSI